MYCTMTNRLLSKNLEDRLPNQLARTNSTQHQTPSILTWRKSKPHKKMTKLMPKDYFVTQNDLLQATRPVMSQPKRKPIEWLLFNAFVTPLNRGVEFCKLLFCNKISLSKDAVGLTVFNGDIGAETRTRLTKGPIG